MDEITRLIGETAKVLAEGAEKVRQAMGPVWEAEDKLAELHRELAYRDATIMREVYADKENYPNDGARKAGHTEKCHDDERLRDIRNEIAGWHIKKREAVAERDYEHDRAKNARAMANIVNYMGR